MPSPLTTAVVHAAKNSDLGVLIWASEHGCPPQQWDGRNRRERGSL